MEKLMNDFSIGLFFWQLVLFVGLLLLLRKVAWNPILNAIEERENNIKKDLEAAQNARKEMQNLTADNERILKEARSEREEILKEAREMRAKSVEDTKEEVRVLKENLMAKAKEEIQNEKLTAISELKNQVAELSIGIAEKLVKEQLASKDNQVKLIENMLKDVKLN
jgi:F-type H+-transporting ATPase subunit b